MALIRMNHGLWLVAGCLVINCLQVLAQNTENGTEPLPIEGLAAIVSDPLNATYTLEARPVRLIQGYAQKRIAAESAMLERTSVISEPLSGDLDGDGDDDVALIIAHDPGGSGTFYYVSVAWNLSGGYLGSNGVLLGDRIVLRQLAVRHGLLIVDYLEHGMAEPMTATPKASRTLVLYANKNELKIRARLDEGEQLFEGSVRIGHEVRTFRPCEQNVEYWIDGKSLALPQISAGYRESLQEAEPYSPLFIVVSGYTSTFPAEGFAENYAASIFINQLIGIRPEGVCNSTRIK